MATLKLKEIDGRAPPGVKGRRNTAARPLKEAPWPLETAPRPPKPALCPLKQPERVRWMPGSGASALLTPELQGFSALSAGVPGALALLVLEFQGFSALSAEAQGPNKC